MTRLRAWLAAAVCEQPDAGIARHLSAATKQFPSISSCSYNQIMPIWDEPKRRRNIRSHGLDFVGCEAVFDGPVVTWEDDREA
jgi:hypothetical protein